MPERTCTIELNQTDKKITIAGINESLLEIDYTSDIDFTQLVKILAEQMDSGDNFNITENYTNSEDMKIVLIISTIKEILRKYNEVLDTVEKEADNDAL